MEEQRKLSISIACKRRPAKPPSRPAAADPAPAAQFVTEFDPSPTLPPAAGPVVIPPLPNSFNFGPRKPSSLPTSEEDDDDPSSCTFYGVTLRDAAAALLAGYGWSEGQCVGKSHKDKKEDTKTAHHGDRCRAGKLGFGYNPSEHDPRKSRTGDWTFTAGNKMMTGNGAARKRGRDASGTTEDKDRNAGRRHKSSGEKRSRTTSTAKASEKERGRRTLNP